MRKVENERMRKKSKEIVEGYMSQAVLYALLRGTAKRTERKRALRNEVESQLAKKVSNGADRQNDSGSARVAETVPQVAGDEGGSPLERNSTD